VVACEKISQVLRSIERKRAMGSVQRAELEQDLNQALAADRFKD
jgi:hypothetical protein